MTDHDQDKGEDRPRVKVTDKRRVRADAEGAGEVRARICAKEYGGKEAIRMKLTLLSPPTAVGLPLRRCTRLGVGHGAGVCGLDSFEVWRRPH